MIARGKRKRDEEGIPVGMHRDSRDSDEGGSCDADSDDSDASSHSSRFDSYLGDAEDEAFALCEGADDAGDDGAAYEVDVAQLLAHTGEDQDADGWEDCDVSGSCR